MSQKELSPTLNENILICLRKIIQSIELHSRDLVKRVGLTGPQLTILAEISKKDGELSVGEIADSISLSMGTVTGILERLEKRGLLARNKSPRDKRRVLIMLTEKGKEVINNAPPLLQEAFVKELDSLQAWEQTMILASLQRLVAMMNARDISAAPILATGRIDSTIPAEPDGQNSPY